MAVPETQSSSMGEEPDDRALAWLDPPDWEEFRAVGKRIIDDVVDYLAGLRERPVWQPIPEDAQAAFRTGLPRSGMPIGAAYEEFLATIMPYPRGNIHPRFWGWVNGSGLPVGMYADLLASAMNPTVGSGESAAKLVEQQVIEWLKQAFDWPVAGSGVLTSGSSMGHIVALGAARVACARAHDWDVRELGAANGPLFTVYGSTETHRSMQRAVELLGFGRRCYRQIPVGPDFRIDIGALREAIKADREAGMHPLCLVGNIGTVNTGAIDPLDELVTVAREEGIWLHLDGAFGAAAYLLPRLRGQLATLNEADSLTIDLHKWFYLPFDAGILLVRRDGILENAYGSSADYLSKTGAESASSTVAFSDRGIEQSRRFRALKVWFALKTHGLDAIAAAIAENVTQVEHLNTLIAESPHLESLSSSPLNVVCFRYIWASATVAELNRANKEILIRLQTSGMAMPSHTVIDGKFVLRVAHINHRSRRSDFDFLVEKVLSIGSQVAAEHAGLSSQETA